MGIFDRTDDKKEKPKHDFSDVVSGSSSTAPAPWFSTISGEPRT